MKKKQYEVMAKFGRIKLGIRRSEINLCNFRKKVKEFIDLSNFPDECKRVLEMSIDSYGRLNVDLDSDLENYRGLDEIITINPTHMSDEEKKINFYNCQPYAQI